MIQKNMYIILLVALASVAQARITAVSDDFSTNVNTFVDWVLVDSVAATELLYDDVSAEDYNDGDPAADLPYSVGMEITGDGLLNDGGLRLDTGDAVVGNEAVGLTIGGTMQNGEGITFSGNLYNDNTSYTDVNVQLWNLTDGTLLAESGAIRVKNGNNLSYEPVDFSLSYTAGATDDGDTLQIRLRDAGTATARDVYLDNFSVTTDVTERTIRLYGVTN